MLLLELVRGQVVDGTVRPHRVVVTPPGLDHDGGIAQAVEPLVAPPERFLVGTHAAYLHCAGGILESKAGEALLGRAGEAAAMTARNWATVLKLQALAGGPGA